MTPAALALIHAQCFTNPRPWSADEFAALLDMHGVFLLTAPDAFLLGRAIAGEAELLTIAVAPAARRQGAARSLLTGFADRAAATGADTAFLEVASDNAPARALYAQDGWQQIGQRASYYGAGIDALILRRNLP